MASLGHPIVADARYNPQKALTHICTQLNCSVSNSVHRSLFETAFPARIIVGTLRNHQKSYFQLILEYITLNPPPLETSRA